MRARPVTARSCSLPTVTTPISRHELWQRLSGGASVALVEALGSAYYDDAHLPGAINIPPDQVDRLAPSLLPDLRSDIVVYCSGSCQNSLIVARRLEALGYSAVRVFEGGKEEWVENDLPVERTGDVDGYRLVVDAMPVAPEPILRFRMLDPSGAPLRDLDPLHDRDIHLIAVSHDLSWYRHVHPEPNGSGAWQVRLELPRGGTYRLFADVKPRRSAALTLAADVVVDGPAPVPVPLALRTSTHVDGFDVVLTGDVTVNASSRVSVAISYDGKPAPLQPHLGALGHLVAIGSADLNYVHVHPLDEQLIPGSVAFEVHVTERGQYALFLDFRVDDVVRTAAFAVAAA